MGAGTRRVRGGLWPILQTATAASAAWSLAALVLDHEHPFVAPIAAFISLGETTGRQGRRAVEWVLGVTFGLAVADLLMFAIGSGTVLIGVVVGLAMAAAMFLGAGPPLVTEAGVSAAPGGHPRPLDRGANAREDSGRAGGQLHGVGRKLPAPVRPEDKGTAGGA